MKILQLRIEHHGIKITGRLDLVFLAEGIPNIECSKSKERNNISPSVSIFANMRFVFQQNVQLTSSKVLAFNDLKQVLNEQDLIQFVCELVFLEIEKDNRKNVVLNFTKNFQDKTEPLEGFRKFQESIKHLYCSVGKILPSLNKLEELKSEMKTNSSIFGSRSVIEYYKMNLIGTVLFDLPEGYTNVIKNFYCVSFKAFCNCNYPPTGWYFLVVTFFL